VSVKVEKDIKIQDLINTVCDIKEVNIDNSSKVSNLVLYTSTRGAVRGIFNQIFKLNQYNMINNTIEAIEVLNRRGREVIREYLLAKSASQELEEN
jgi:hypothetical protein